MLMYETLFMIFIYPPLLICGLLGLIFGMFYVIEKLFPNGSHR